MVEQVMQAKPVGFKQTEIGVFPEDWSIDSIINLASITTGDKNTQDRISDGAYPFFVRSANVERINSFTFDGEAVLTAGDGVGTGKIFHYINGKFDYHQRVYKISDFCEQLDGHFFYLYFSNNFYSRIMQMTAKSSVDSVRREMIADMKIPLPAPEEQAAISGAFRDVNALIASLEKLTAKKRAIKQGAMQELLTGKRRLPGFEGQWEVKKMGDFIKVRHGKSQHEIADENGIYPILATGGIIGKAKTFLYNKSSVLIGRKGTIDRPQFMDTPFWTIDTLFYTEITDEADAKFIYYKFNLIDWYLYNEASGVPSLNASTIEKIESRFPTTKAEQVAIAKVLSDIDMEIQVFEQKLAKYRVLKQGMMQVLLTGKIRLKRNEL